MRKFKHTRQAQGERQEKQPPRAASEHRFSSAERHAAIVENADAVHVAIDASRERHDAERMLDSATLPHR